MKILCKCNLRNLGNLRIGPIPMKVAGDSDILGITVQKLAGRLSDHENLRL